MERVRLAVVGQGYFAQVAILPAFASAENCALTALFSDDPGKQQELRKMYNVEHALSYSEYDAFLRSGAVDAVYLALPNDLHCDYTVRAAQAGVHVLCEKPMAVSSEECERMIRACDEAHVKLMIAYRLHFEEANLSTVDMVKKGELGAPRYFLSGFSLQVNQGNIRTQRERGGGPLFDIGIYCINAARYLFGAEPIEVLAAQASRQGDERFREIPEQVSAIMSFPEQRLATFTCGFGAVDEGFYDVVCTEGRVRLDPAYEYAVGLHQQVTRADGKTKTKDFKKRDQIAAELVYFANCLVNDQTPEPSGWEGLADLRVIEAIRESSRTGQRVPVKAIGREERPSLAQEEAKPAHDKPEPIGAQKPSR